MINTGRNWIRGNRTKPGSGTCYNQETGAETGEGDCRGSLGLKRRWICKKPVMVLQKAVGTILKIGINEIGGSSLANAGNCRFV